VLKKNEQFEKDRATQKKESSGSNDLTSLYERLNTALKRYASRYFRRPQEIEDIVQEAFVRVLEAQNSRKIQVDDAYMYRTTRNLALNTLKKSETRLTDTVGDLLSETVLLESISLEDEFESRERFQLFCSAVRQLPRKCQRVFILRKVYGLSLKEIAERMDISVKTVEVHMTKAIVRCTDYMDAEDNQHKAQVEDIKQSGVSR
jgi:RNA polymerase sigma-70 factor (ECF subfamily)